MLLFVTALSVPLVVESATVAPEAVKLLLNASFNWTVIAEVVIPLARILVGAAVIVDLLASAAPKVKVTVAVLVIAAASSVPVIVAVTATVDEVSVAV